MPLTQTEQDLQKYTYGKVLNLMKDVAQGFEIAGLQAGNSLACLGAIFLKVTVQIAVVIGAPKQEFLQKVSETFDEVTNQTKHERND